MTFFVIAFLVSIAVVFVVVFAVVMWLAKWTTGLDPNGAWRAQMNAQTEALKREG